MISKTKIKDIDNISDEGKLLFAALAILTSIDNKDIKNEKWGGMVHPDDALERIQDLANKMFYEEEYKSYLKSKERDNKINSILWNDKKNSYIWTMKKIIKSENEQKQFIIVNELSEVFYGLKGGYPQFTSDWELAKPLSNEKQLSSVQRGTFHKLEILYIWKKSFI